MRIIGGKNKGKKLILPDEAITRPTTDRVRESLFNILSHHPDFDWNEAYVLDAFAGSGALGLEALSRGATHVTFVESHPKIIPILKKNMETIPGDKKLLTHPIENILPTFRPMDLVFLDPPYKKGIEIPILTHLKNQGWINNGTLVCLEMHRQDDLPEIHWFQCLDHRQYGQTKIIFGKLQD